MTILKHSSLFIFCITWSIVGFPLLALVTNTLELPSTGFSFAFRVLAAGSATIILFAAKLKPNLLVVTLYLTFWVIYFFRLSLATVLDFEDLRNPDYVYWMWAFGACFMPTMAVLMFSNRVPLDRLYHWLLIVSTFTALLALVTANTGSWGVESSLVNYNRLSVSALNPISMGHLGVTSALLGISYFLSERSTGWYKWVALAAVFLGLATALLSNSRGPLVAFSICFLLLILAGARRRKTYWVIFIFVTASLFIFLKQSDLFFSEGGIISRFLGVASLDAATHGRVLAYQGAINQFLGSPVLGDTVEEKITGSYPHNVILEALMSTGLIGGIPFIAFTLLAMLCAWRLVRKKSRQLWVGLLATQYLTGAMFSGAIYSVTQMWVLLALAISIEWKERHELPSSRVGRHAVNP